VRQVSREKSVSMLKFLFAVENLTQIESDINYMNEERMSKVGTPMDICFVAKMIQLNVSLGPNEKTFLEKIK
jgi:hypothetical protein